MYADGGMTVIKSGVGGICGGIGGILKADLHAVGRVSELFANGRKDAEVGNRCQLLTPASVRRQFPVTDDWSLDTGHTRAMTCARMWWSAPVGSRCAPNSLYGACFL